MRGHDFAVPDSVRSPGSQFLHSIDQLSARPVVAWVLLSADAVWVLFSIVAGFPGRLETVFQTVTSAVTLALVFVIQHTQSREQLVTQRKLDEILAALPNADNTIIALEEASDDELAAVHADHRDLREEALTAAVPPATSVHSEGTR